MAQIVLVAGARSTGLAPSVGLQRPLAPLWCCYTPSPASVAMSRHQKRLALEGLAWEREQMAAAASPPSPDPFDRLPPDCLLRVLIALKAQTLARFAVAVPVGFRVSQRLPDVLRGIYHLKCKATFSQPELLLSLWSE